MVTDRHFFLFICYLFIFGIVMVQSRFSLYKYICISCSLEKGMWESQWKNSKSVNVHTHLCACLGRGMHKVTVVYSIITTTSKQINKYCCVITIFPVRRNKFNILDNLGKLMFIYFTIYFGPQGQKCFQCFKFREILNAK